MKNRNQNHDPELDSLLTAFREIHPSREEKSKWRAAVEAELKAGETPKRAPFERPQVVRMIFRIAAQVSVAASLGFIIGAYFIEHRRSENGPALFSQMDAKATIPPLTMDEEREVVRIRSE